MKARDPHVAIVIVNWNGWRDTIACIQSCLSLEQTSATIIVCDNASSDGSVENIRAWAEGESSPPPADRFPVKIDSARLPKGVAVLDRASLEAGDDAGGAQLLIVPTGGNFGFAGGNNVGLRWALAHGSDYAWLLNNDAMAAPDALSRLLARFKATPDLGICGSTLMEFFEPQVVQAWAGAMNRYTYRGRHLGFREPLAKLNDIVASHITNDGELLYPVGASLIVSREFLERVGLMDEGYFLYYEEADWVLRGESDFRIMTAPDSLVYHKGGAAAGSTPTGVSAKSVSFLYRSRLRIARRFTPRSMPRVILGILDEAARGLVRGRRGRAIAAARALTGRVCVPTEMQA